MPQGLDRRECHVMVDIGWDNLDFYSSLRPHNTKENIFQSPVLGYYLQTSSNECIHDSHFLKYVLLLDITEQYGSISIGRSGNE